MKKNKQQIKENNMEDKREFEITKLNKTTANMITQEIQNITQKYGDGPLYISQVNEENKIYGILAVRIWIDNKTWKMEYYITDKDGYESYLTWKNIKHGKIKNV